jgi:hypothetical protein
MSERDNTKEEGVVGKNKFGGHAEMNQIDLSSSEKLESSEVGVSKDQQYGSSGKTGLGGTVDTSIPGTVSITTGSNFGGSAGMGSGTSKIGTDTNPNN